MIRKLLALAALIGVLLMIAMGVGFFWHDPV